MAQFAQVYVCIFKNAAWRCQYQEVKGYMHELMRLVRYAATAVTYEVVMEVSRSFNHVGSDRSFHYQVM